MGIHVHIHTQVAEATIEGITCSSRAITIHINAPTLIEQLLGAFMVHILPKIVLQSTSKSTLTCRLQGGIKPSLRFVATVPVVNLVKCKLGYKIRVLLQKRSKDLVFVISLLQ